MQAVAGTTEFRFERRRLNSALREFLRAAVCKVSIVQEERKRRVLFEPIRSILDKRNEAVEWQRPIQEADDAFYPHLQTQPFFGSLLRRSRADQPESSGRPRGSREPAREFGLVGAPWGRDKKTPECLVETFWCRGGGSDYRR